MNSNTNASACASASATGVTAIDFRTLPDFIPSMCIPRVYPNISEGRIRKIFDELNGNRIVQAVTFPELKTFFRGVPVAEHRRAGIAGDQPCQRKRHKQNSDEHRNCKH